MANLVPTAIRVPEGCADELQEIFTSLASALPDDPTFSQKIPDENERKKILSHEVFLQFYVLHFF